MIFSGLAYTGKAPFDTVLIHGIVRDSQGRKMSKIAWATASTRWKSLTSTAPTPCA